MTVRAYSKRTLQSGAAETKDGSSLLLQGAGACALQVTGTFDGTVTFEGSVNEDSATWVAIQGLNANDGTVASTATAAGLFYFSTVGLNAVRARVSTYVSGSITVVGREVDMAIMPPSMQIAGTLTPTKLAGAGYDSQVATRSGSLAAATTETVVTVTDEAVLNSLTFATNEGTVGYILLIFEARNQDGTFEQIRLIGNSGAGFNAITPSNLRTLGSDELFQFLTDSTSTYKLALKNGLSMYFGSGFRIRVKNTSPTTAYNAGAQVVYGTRK